MESSKTGINILIVITILLIGLTIAATLMQGQAPKEEAQTSIPTPTEPTTPIETAPISTSTEEMASTTPTAPVAAASTTIIVQGFTGKNWTWVKTVASSTKVTTPKKLAAFTITFNVDGSLKGTTDCNSFFGSYRVIDTNLSFGPFGSTKMACTGSQESVFMSTLELASTYTLVNNMLVLTLPNNGGTMTFK